VPPEGVKRQRTRTDGGEVDGGRRNQSANTHQARGAAGAALTLGPVLAACGSFSSSSGGSLKIGYVSPETGPLAGFGEADKFVIGALNAKFKEGIDIGGDKRTIEALIRDSQSDSNRAASVANDLILNTGVNRLLSPEPPALSAPSAAHSPLGVDRCRNAVEPSSAALLHRCNVTCRCVRIPGTNARARQQSGGTPSLKEERA
jgi:hypothetical protein